MLIESITGKPRTIELTAMTVMPDEELLEHLVLKTGVLLLFHSRDVYNQSMWCRALYEHRHEAFKTKLLGSGGLEGVLPGRLMFDMHPNMMMYDVKKQLIWHTGQLAVINNETGELIYHEHYRATFKMVTKVESYVSKTNHGTKDPSPYTFSSISKTDNMIDLKFAAMLNGAMQRFRID